MGRIFFFIGEGLRALRRSAAPSLAAIVTVAVTVLLLGVLIPVLQTTQGKTNEIRDQVGLSVFLSDVDVNGAPTDDPTGNPPPQGGRSTGKEDLDGVDNLYPQVRAAL